MVIVRTTLTALPEKQLEVVQTLLSLVEPVGKEPGCKSYCAFYHLNDKNRLMLLGEWETQKDLDRHVKSNRFGVLLGTRALLSEPPQICIHTISKTRGMETIQMLRQEKS